MILPRFSPDASFSFAVRSTIGRRTYSNLMGECSKNQAFAPRPWGRPLPHEVVNVGAGCYPPGRVRRPGRVDGAGSGSGGSGPRPADGSDSEEVGLVSAMARGDSAALGALYDLHAPHMLCLARSIVATPSAAEDIVQDVFLEAWRKAKSYDPTRGSVKTWLLLRTRSRSIDFRRAASQSRALAVSDDFWAEHPGAPGSDVSFAPDQAAVRSALFALPKEQREALLLGYFEGLSSSEIAARVGSPVGTIKTRVAAALSKLRAALSDRPGETT
jgi:RNA polymerase sigma-70 factor, ECF subfamily